jgi:hypothetical protein
MTPGNDWYVSRPEFQAKLLTLKSYVDSIAEDSKHGDKYSGKRGAMVVDVLASRQRQYKSRVLKIVEDWSSRVPYASLRDLVENPLDQAFFGLRKGESDSMTKVAAGLLRFGEDFEIDKDDQICKRWARAVEEFRFAPKLDPYVGHVDGMGIALFAYLRKLSGVDAIKPDVRVRKKLNSFGFDVPDGTQELMMLSEILADELGISKSKFDDFLWRDIPN